MLRPHLMSPTVLHLRALAITLPHSAVNSSVSVRHYAKPGMAIPSLGKKPSKLKGQGPMIEKKILPVEADTNKLVNYVCGSNINKEGEDIQLQADSEYPDWLWNLNCGKPPPLEELDPDSDYYWIRVRKIAMRRSLSLMKLKKF